MSQEIDIENCPNLFSVFEAIEQKGERFILSGGAKHHKEKRKQRSSTTTERQAAKRQRVERRASDSTGQTLKVGQPRERIRSGPPCPLFDGVKIQNDSRLTEAAKQLSDEELTLLYEDVLKPLDLHAMLHERRKKLPGEKMNSEVKTSLERFQKIDKSVRNTASVIVNNK